MSLCLNGRVVCNCGPSSIITVIAAICFFCMRQCLRGEKLVTSSLGVMDLVKWREKGYRERIEMWMQI